jgi:ribosome-binding factor A
MSRRIERVNQLIKKELSEIFLKEADFGKGILVTITRVEASSNLIQAKVYISVFPKTKAQKILKNLSMRIYDIQQMLNKRLKMRPIPKIKFIEEKKTAEAARIEQLLAELQKNQ